jgi:hypothetical protein
VLKVQRCTIDSYNYVASYNQTMVILWFGFRLPASSKGYQFVLVATNYFTKWTKAVLLKNMMHKEVIHFILEHTIHRFGIPQTLTVDHGSSFMSHQVHEFVESLKIKLLSSLPYYAQVNGQAESSKKTLIKLIKKKIVENPKR